MTEADILEEMKNPIEDKVTPYHMFTYEEQIAKKREWLNDSVLKEFCNNLEK